MAEHDESEPEPSAADRLDRLQQALKDFAAQVDWAKLARSRQQAWETLAMDLENEAPGDEPEPDDYASVEVALRFSFSGIGNLMTAVAALRSILREEGAQDSD